MSVDVSKLQRTRSPGYFRDPETGVIINMNESELKAYQYARDKSLQFTSLQKSHDNLKSELEQIKKVLGL